jgi:hypothetical protein
MRAFVSIVLTCLLSCLTASGQQEVSYRILWKFADYSPWGPPIYFVSVDQRLVGEKQLLSFVCFFAQKENLSLQQPFDVKIFHQLDSVVPMTPESEEEARKFLGLYMWRPGEGGRLAVRVIQPDGSRRGKNTKADHRKYCGAHANRQDK